jgi:glycosyltransferase involved in cell wall biosynthesis
MASGINLPPIHVLPLAHQLSSQTGVIAASKPPHLPEFSDGFVLCVGTFEPRKNQLRLAEAWAVIAPDIAHMPTLLIVGKLGWLKPTSLRQLAEFCRTSKKIILVHDISDGQLAWLYERCLFTVFLSLDEGWGLPVGESLAFGKVCLASNVGGIPEAGGPFALYVDPVKLDEITAALRSLIADKERRQTLEKYIARNFRLRDWSHVASDIIKLECTIRTTLANQ